MKRSLGARPVAQPVAPRSHNAFRSAFEAHRDCDVRSVEYSHNGAACTSCGVRWTIKRDSRGEPIGCTVLPRVNVEALVG